MTKEEHNKIIDFVNSDDYMLLNSYISKPYEETIIEQDKEINELQDRIDKAIEYIENDLQSFLYSIEYKTLLDILKGDNNEQRRIRNVFIRFI